MIAATVGIAGLLQLLMLALRRGARQLATPLRIVVRRRDARLFRQGDPRHDRERRAAIAVVAGAIIASASPSAVSWLYFANRLIELPLGIVGVAMGTVLVPELTRALRGDDRDRDDRCRVARARTRGRAGAAGDARIDRAEPSRSCGCCSSTARSPQPTPRPPRRR